MAAQLVHTDALADTSTVVSALVDCLAHQGVAVFPTDSVYGIGTLATPHNPGLARIFEIKERPLTQTLPWLVDSADALLTWGVNVPDWVQALARAFWPGALTIIVEAAPQVPSEYVLPAHNGQPASLALRMPDAPLIVAAMKKLGHPVATTSANTHGNPSATDGAHIETRLLERADLVVDGGFAPLAVASTIVDATGNQMRIVRAGALAEQDLLGVIAQGS